MLDDLDQKLRSVLLTELKYYNNAVSRSYVSTVFQKPTSEKAHREADVKKKISNGYS